MIWRFQVNGREVHGWKKIAVVGGISLAVVLFLIVGLPIILIGLGIAIVAAIAALVWRFITGRTPSWVNITLDGRRIR